LYEKLSESNHEIFFVTYGGEDDHDYLKKDSKIKLLTKPERVSNKNYGFLVPKIHKDILSRVDIIKSHQVLGSAFALYSSKIFNKPYIARCGYLNSVFSKKSNRPTKEKFRSRLEELITFKLSNACCVPSANEKNYIAYNYSLDKEKIFICPNWIDTNLFKPDQKIKKRPNRLIFVGRFEHQKQPLAVLEIIKGLDDIELLMIGNGSLKNLIVAKAKNFGIKIVLLDRILNEELPRYLNSASIYILPTLYEGGSPKTVLEAMSCGLPILSTNSFGVDECYQDNVHGYKFNSNDISGFRNSVINLLSDYKKGHKFGIQGRQHIIDNYSIEESVKREENLFYNVL